MNTNIEGACEKLISYIERENYKGYDPYDALTSSLFKLPVFKQSKFIRFGFQQLVKRSPLNLRPLLLIKKGYNPVTLGLCIQAYTNLAVAGEISKEAAAKKCNHLINELTSLKSKGYHGACWGYDFPWQSRYAQIPAFEPTIVATGFITNALFQYYKFSGDQNAFNLCRSACDFILTDIKKTADADGTFCFTYSPFDDYQVFNASMKGVRTLAQVYSVTKEKHLAEAAALAAKYVVKNQSPDGSWKYGANHKAEWIDNYHTGYVLDCLDEYSKNTGDASFQNAINKGFEYYFNNFFDSGFQPKFYNNSLYPIDCTAAAQSILTLCRFGKIETASRVAEFMIKEMQNEEGYFYFRKYKHFTEKVSFMRWSNAWMAAGLTELKKYL